MFVRGWGGGRVGLGHLSILCRCMTKEQRSAESKCFWQEDWSRPKGSRMCGLCLCDGACALLCSQGGETVGGLFVGEQPTFTLGVVCELTLAFVCARSC